MFTDQLNLWSINTALANTKNLTVFSHLQYARKQVQAGSAGDSAGRTVLVSLPQYLLHDLEAQKVSFKKVLACWIESNGIATLTVEVVGAVEFSRLV